MPLGGAGEKKNAYCRTHLIRVNTRYGTFAVSPNGAPVLQPDDIAEPDSGLLFVQGWFPPEKDIAGELFRWAAPRAEVRIAGGRGALVFEIEPGPGTDGSLLEMRIAA